ncbi:glycosyltransferase family 2 protein [Smaragdicoccus niigatensis]|uniref:glycosyltransferase family 2 protein n=1 Tax=Smaragdicoccus niigatensis TaxID=359359 RepID=UPI000365A643|nr:glycosyltransferase family 2 protein [Smaragdicoccus niigatensis]
MNPLVSVVIVTYNSADHIAHCLEPLADSPDFEISVIDNASADNTVEVVRSRFPKVTVIESPVNAGFAVAVNTAAKLARGDVVLLLNPDAVISAAGVRELVEEVLRPGVGVVGPRIDHPTGRLRIMSAGRQPHLWPIFTHFSGLSRLSASRIMKGHYLFQSRIAGGRIDTEWVTGACMAVRGEVWRQLGGLSERWFMYAEDIEFCHRVRAAGFRIVALPNVTATHILGASSDPDAPPDSAWILNLFDYYCAFLAPTRIHMALWKVVVVCGLASRSVAFGVLARLRRERRDEWIRESHRFRIHAGALWKQPFSSRKR